MDRQVQVDGDEEESDYGFTMTWDDVHGGSSTGSGDAGSEGKLVSMKTTDMHVEVDQGGLGYEPGSVWVATNEGGILEGVDLELVRG